MTACRCCARTAGRGDRVHDAAGRRLGAAASRRSTSASRRADDPRARGREPPARAGGRRCRRRARREPAPAPRQRRASRRGAGRPAATSTPRPRGPRATPSSPREPGLPLIAHGADCLTAALVAPGGSRLAVAHAGWRGLVAGVLEAAAERVGPGFAAAVGPGAGACCYEVGDDVAGPLRARFGDDVVARRPRRPRGLRAARARARRARPRSSTAGPVHDLRPERFHSHRRDGAGSGRQAVIAYLEGAPRERRARGRAREPRGRARGRRRGGARARAARRARSSCWRRSSTSSPTTWRRSPPPASSSWARTASSSCSPSRRSPRDRFTWDFIGHLQSRKARDLVGPRAPRALALDALGRRAPRSQRASEPIACLVEVNVAGEESKQGLAPGELDAFLEAVAALPNVRVEGLMTMPPLADVPGGVAAALRGAARARGGLERALGAAARLRAASRWARARTTPWRWRRGRRSSASDRPSTADRAYSLASHGSR